MAEGFEGLDDSDLNRGSRRAKPEPGLAFGGLSLTSWVVYMAGALLFSCGEISFQVGGDRSSRSRFIEA